MRRLLAVLAVAAVLPVLGAPPAAASTLDQYGWWWRARTGLLPVPAPAPPTVPEDGIAVGRAANGDNTALAAVRYRLAEGETDPVLTLTVADEQNGPGASILACVTVGQWFPGQPGRWEQRARVTDDCRTGAVAGVRAEDGSTWSFALAPLLRDRLLDVALVPGDPPEGAPPVGFQVAFERPEEGSLATRPPPPPAPPPDTTSGGEGNSTGSPSSPSSPPPPSEPANDPPPGSGGDAPPPASSGGFAPPPVRVEPPAVATQPAPAASEPAPEVAPPAAERPPPVAGDPVAQPAAPAGVVDEPLPPRLVGLLAVLATLAVAVLLYRERAVPAGGAAASSEPRGLGRFARPRRGDPTPLV